MKIPAKNALDKSRSPPKNKLQTQKIIDIGLQRSSLSSRLLAVSGPEQKLNSPKRKIRFVGRDPTMGKIAEVDTGVNSAQPMESPAKRQSVKAASPLLKLDEEVSNA